MRGSPQKKGPLPKLALAWLRSLESRESLNSAPSSKSAKSVKSLGHGFRFIFSGFLRGLLLSLGSLGGIVGLKRLKVQAKPRAKQKGSISTILDPKRTTIWGIQVQVGFKGEVKQKSSASTARPEQIAHFPNCIGLWRMVQSGQ